MASSSYRAAALRQQSSPARRAASFALAVAAHIVVILLLLRLAPRLDPPSEDPPLSTFSLDAERPAARAAPRSARRAQARAPAAGAAAPTRPPPLPVPQPEPSPEWPTMLSERFDLATLPRSGSARGEAARGDAGDRGDSSAVYGPGAGPGGERLYDADWQREPTSAELNGYLPRGAPPNSWALIACRTAPDFRVENCRVLGESPIGSGLGSAMRQAAWQFRILPPRRGNEKLIGAWVRIRISWTERGASAR